MHEAVPTIPWSAQGRGEDLSSSDDCPVEVDIGPPPATACVEISDEEDSQSAASDDDVVLMPDCGDDIDLERLHLTLFKRRRLNFKGSASGEVGINDDEIAQLFSSALEKEPDAPSPLCYRMMKRPSSKPKKKPAARSAMASSMTPALATSSPPHAAPLGLPPEIASTMPVAVLIEPYIGQPVSSKTTKRVYSHAYHKIRDACVSSGLSLEDSKKFGRMVGKEASLKFQAMAS